MLNKFLNFMKEQGWNVELNSENTVCTPKIIEERYANIPLTWLDLIGTVKSIKNHEDTTWFLCADDFKTQPSDAFRWNEWEIISLENAEDDAQWEKEIKEFWDNHLPIMLSVEGVYSYYAVFTKDGSIVYGEEPEFEECTKAADSFDEFIEKIVNGEITIE